MRILSIAYIAIIDHRRQSHQDYNRIASKRKAEAKPGSSSKMKEDIQFLPQNLIVKHEEPSSQHQVVAQASPIQAPRPKKAEQNGANNMIVRSQESGVALFRRYVLVHICVLSLVRVYCRGFAPKPTK